MTAERPFLRILKVTIGPLEEWRGNTAGSVIEIISDGSSTTLRASCAIHKTIMGQPSPSTISLWNLARDTRDAIKAGLTKITVEAGWQNTDMHLVFQGSIMSVMPTRSGADIITTIQALPGYGALVRSTASVTYGSGKDVRQTVIDLAKKLPGITIDERYITGLSGKIPNGGWSFAGATREALNQLAQEYGFSWSVQNGVFQAVGDRTTLAGSLFELDGEQGGLIDISPILNGPMQIHTGVQIQSMYAPGAVPGSRIRVKSALKPNLSGEYRLTKVSYSLDTHSDAWTMNAESHKGLV